MWHLQIITGAQYDGSVALARWCQPWASIFGKLALDSHNG
jgi:hypothetical protein